MLQPPRFVQPAHAADGELLYPWDEWHVRDYYMFTDPDDFKRLDALTNKANTALTIAAGEWICVRFAPLDADPIPLQFLEAAWAGIIHPAYCEYTETVDDQWRGPVRAPLAVTIAIANDALFCLRDDPHVATRACWMRNLARHILSAPDRFDAWFDVCTERLARYHAKNNDPGALVSSVFDDFPAQGVPVPREALDPAYPYDPVEAPQLLDRFLRSLDVSANRFLRSPLELRDVDDLPGPPYRYVPRD